MLRDVKLLSYLPLFVQEYEEIQKIMAAENPEIQLAEDETEIVKNNQYIPTCNKTGISRYEKMLGITPGIDDTLEARISRVLIRWNNFIPYTYRELISKLDSLCGEGNYELNPDFTNYALEVITALTLSGQTDELDYLLGYIIPANITMISRNEIIRETTGTAYTGTATVECSRFTIVTKVNTDYNINGQLTNGGYTVTTRRRTIYTN